MKWNLAGAPRQRTRTAKVCCAVATLLLALSGCGGSGGGGSGGSGGSGSGGSSSGGSSSGGSDDSTDQSAQLQVSPSQITVRAQTTDAAPTASLTASVQVASSAGVGQTFYIEGTETHNGIDSISASASGAYENITIVFKSPAPMGPGTYSDTITLKACDDKACTRQVANSPLAVSLTYTVTGPVPQLDSIAPAMATAGSPPVTLTLQGSTFEADSVVLWNGTPLATTLVSASQLTAQVPASNLATAGTYAVTVQNGSDVNAVSSAVSFTVAALPPLVLSGISPSQVPAGGPGFTLAVIGTGFSSTSSIVFNGTALSTSYVSSTLLRAPVAATLVAQVGTAAINVTGTSGQGQTAPVTLKIIAPNVDAVSYQMNAAHTGAVTFKSLALPASSAWSTDLGGSPSYALIVGGIVYVTAAVNGDSELWALNGTTGAKIWGPIALSGNVSAAYDNGRLFVVSGNSVLSQVISALDPATGNSLWSATAPGGWFPAPPVAANGVVYTTNGGAVGAFDESTGAVLWQSNVGGTSGIVAVTLDGLYGASPCTALDLQPTVGTTLWSNNSGCSGGGGATPVVANGIVYAPSSSAGSSGTIFDAETGALKGTYSASVIPAIASGTGFFLSNGTLQGRANSNSQVLWSFAGDAQLSTAPIVVNGYVFIGSQGGNLYGLDASTGQQVWTKNLGAAIPPSSEGIGLFTGLAAGDGLLVVPNGTQVTAFVLSTSP